MKIFKNYDKKRKIIENLSKEELLKIFNNLENFKRIDIIIKWFGLQSLFNEMVENEKGLYYLKEKLIEVEK